MEDGHIRMGLSMLSCPPRTQRGSPTKEIVVQSALSIADKPRKVETPLLGFVYKTFNCQKMWFPG